VLPAGPGTDHEGDRDWRLARAVTVRHLEPILAAQCADACGRHALDQRPAVAGLERDLRVAQPGKRPAQAHLQPVLARGQRRGGAELPHQGHRRHHRVAVQIDPRRPAQRQRALVEGDGDQLVRPGGQVTAVLPQLCVAEMAALIAVDLPARLGGGQGPVEQAELHVQARSRRPQRDVAVDQGARRLGVGARGRRRQTEGQDHHRGGGSGALDPCAHSSYSPRIMATPVKAHIAGTVWKIEVAIGDSVGEGQTVVILESMKMEMPVEAPAAGRVARIAVSSGQPVEEGATLIELE
jgi:acetyl-CoA carboxylase biotin carboxyl carrier protein